jgi:hypothetical protein
MVSMRNPSNILAAFGLALGAVFGLAGTFVARPNLQAVLWGIDVAGLVMAAAILCLKYFRMERDIVASGFIVFAIRPAELVMLRWVG